MKKERGSLAEKLHKDRIPQAFPPTLVSTYLHFVNIINVFGLLTNSFDNRRLLC